MRISKCSLITLIIAGGIIIVLISLFPFLWTVATSLKTRIQINTYPPVFLFKPVLTNYYDVFLRSNFLKNLLDSTVVAVGTVALSVFIGTLAAFGVARFNAGGRSFSFSVLSMRMLPPIAVVIPLYVLMRRFGLLDRHEALIVSYTTFNLPFVIWIMVGFFKDIPRELEEAAMIDGCALWQVFWKVSLPLAKPGLVAVAILCLIFSWNEFLFALVLTGVNVKTVPVAVAEYVTDREIFWGQMSAVGILASLPVLIFAIFVQKHLARGLTLGALKA